MNLERLGTRELAERFVEASRSGQGEPDPLLSQEVRRRLAAGDEGAALAFELASLALAAGTDDPAETVTVAPPEVGAVLALLSTWPEPAAARAILAFLADERQVVRDVAATVLAGMGPAAVETLIHALDRARDPALRLALVEALGRMPQAPAVRAALLQAWESQPAGERWQLAAALSEYGDREFIPLVREALERSQGRQAWARCRVALEHLAGPGKVKATGPPPLAPDEPLWAAELAAGARELMAGGLQDEARRWVKEGLATLSQQEETVAGAVDWYAREELLELDDVLEGRGPENRLSRYVGYTYGALHYHGALRASEARQVLALAGLTPPGEDDLWAALTADPRLRIHPGRICALPEAGQVDLLLQHRDESGLVPAAISLRAMALASRGLAHLAWTAQEEEAARRLLDLLPEGLRQPERISSLQMAMRGAADALAAFRSWLGEAISQGLQVDDALKNAMIELWNHTARWELFGHSPWSASEILSLARAREEARGADSPAASRRPRARRLRRRH